MRPYALIIFTSDNEHEVQSLTNTWLTQHPNHKIRDYQFQIIPTEARTGIFYVCTMLVREKRGKVTYGDKIAQKIQSQVPKARNPIPPPPAIIPDEPYNPYSDDPGLHGQDLLPDNDYELDN